MSTSTLPIRRTARLLIFNPRDELLLIQYEAARDIDPARPGARAFWYTPGGGIEAGESHEEAAIREMREETGISAAIGAHVASWTGPITLFRHKTTTEARFFMVRAPTDALDTSDLAATEGDPVLDARWFGLDALRSLGEPLVPEGLVALAAELLSGRIPTEPVLLSSKIAAADLIG